MVHPFGCCHVPGDFEGLGPGCTAVIAMDHKGLECFLTKGEPDSAGVLVDHRSRIVEGVVGVPGDLLDLPPSHAVVGASFEE